MKFDPADVQNLLRQRREIMPPDDFFDDFLLDFQHRQRVEALQRPTWEILWDRANLFLDGFRVPAMAYASIVAVAVGIVGVMVSGQGPTPGSSQVASVSPAISAVAVNVPVANVSTNLPPSYVLENRPVSNDRPFSF